MDIKKNTDKKPEPIQIPVGLKLMSFAARCQFNCYCSFGLAELKTLLISCRICKKNFHFSCTKIKQNLMKGNSEYIFECSNCKPKEFFAMKKIQPDKKLINDLECIIFMLFLEEKRIFFGFEDILKFVNKNREKYNLICEKNEIEKALNNKNKFLKRKKENVENQFDYSLCNLEVFVVLNGLKIVIKRSSHLEVEKKIKEKEELKRKKIKAKRRRINSLFKKGSYISTNRNSLNLDKNCLDLLTETEKESLLEFLPEIDRNSKGLSDVFYTPFFKRDMALYLNMLEAGDFDFSLRPFRNAEIRKRNKKDLDENVKEVEVANDFKMFWSDQLVDSIWEKVNKVKN